MERKKYIHYGHNSFDRNLFTPISNMDRWVKPSGGFWASPMDSDYGWGDWCRRNSFHSYRLLEYFKFKLSENAKVIHIYSSKQLKDLPKTEENMDMWCCLDFEQLLADGWDAIELHLSEEIFEDVEYCGGLYWKLYGWDCDSILIMNPDVVEVV